MESLKKLFKWISKTDKRWYEKIAEIILIGIIISIVIVIMEIIISYYMGL